MVDLLLKNAKVYTAEGIVEAGLAVEGGHIFKIAKETNLPEASERINLKGNLVLPGLIDSHVHLRDQQLAYKEDFFSGTAAAAAGGVTSALDMPNNKPVTMSAEALRERMRLAKTKTIVNVGFFSAFPRSLREVRSIVKEGAIGFKLYMSQRMGGLDIYDDAMLLQGFGKAQEQNVPVAIHAEDAEMLESNRRRMESAGRRDVDAYLEVHSTGAETKAVKRVVELVKKSRAHIHFCHVSSATGLSAIINAKNAGLRVTCEVTPHHLLLSSDYLQRRGTLALTNPPLRRKEDTEALWIALKRGSIDTIASDHAPHPLEEKDVESVWEARPGIPGLETMLPLLLTHVNEGHLTIRNLVKVTSERPAEIFNLKAKGSVAQGYSADLVAVDVKQEYKIDASRFYSKAKHSPFGGWKVKGRLVKTFVNGRLVMDEGEVVAKPGTGRIVRGESRTF